jgi:lysozyme family protein
MKKTLQEWENDIMDFEESFKRLMVHEGGYSNNPTDPGGETMWGITKRVARLNGYPGPMRELPIEKAKEIARKEYWNPISADLLPKEVKFDVFDAAYNSGPMQAIRWLQKALFVDEDGVVGDATKTALNSYKPAAIVARFNGYRLDAMNNMNAWATFGKGWSQRVAENLISTEG